MDSDYAQRLSGAGFEPLSQEPGLTQVTFYGTGAPLAGGHEQTHVGDPVEVFRADASGRGVWQGGLVALSPVTQGCNDGSYPGEDVIWVGWSADYKRTPGGQRPKGDEWPAELVRAVPQAPSTFSMSEFEAVPWNTPTTTTPVQDFLAIKLASKQAESGVQDVFSELAALGTVARFAYNPQEPRDTHGEWTEGGGSLGQASAAVGQGQGQRNPPNLPGYQGAAYGPHLEPIKAGTQAQVDKAIDFVMRNAKGAQNLPATREGAVQGLEAGAEEIYRRAVTRTEVSWTGEGQSAAKDRAWYYHANALARQFAHRWNFDNSTAAGVIAAYSPQSAWIFPEQETALPSPTSAKKAQSQDVRLAENTLNQIATHAKEKVEITPALMDMWQSGVKTPNYRKEFPQYTMGDAVDESRLDPDKPYRYPGKLKYGVGPYTGPESEFDGFTPHVGTYAQEDLPADYLADVWATHDTVKGMHDMMTNAAMIARGHSVDEVLRGCKTRSFYNDIVDPQHVQDATVDVHMLRAMTLNEGLDTTSSSALGTTPEGYRIANEAIQKGAALHGLKPNEYQAIIWEEWRKENPPAKRAAQVRLDPTIKRNVRKQDDAAIVRGALAPQAQMSDLVHFAVGESDDDGGDMGGEPEKLADPVDIYDVDGTEPDWDDPDYQADQEATLENLQEMGAR